MAQLTPSPKQAFLDSEGNQLVGGKLYTYIAGTTTPLATYSDAAGATPNTNPIILDARGEATIYLLAQSYKFVLKTSADVTIYTQDSVVSPEVLLSAEISGISSDLAASSGSTLVGYIASGTGAEATTVQAKLRESISLADFGAVGNGTTDDTVDIQTALDSGAEIIRGTPGATYLVDYSGSSTVNGVAQRYCLQLPAGVLFDLNGSTLKAADASNASIISNSGAGASQDADLGLINGTLDCNRANQTTPATGEIGAWWFHDTLRLRLENLKVIEARQYAGRVLKADYLYARNLICTGSDGDGFSFGVQGSSQWVRYADIDSIHASACLGTYGGGSLQGNPMIFTAKNTNIGKVYGEYSSGGVKLQDDSSDVNIDEVNVIGPTNGSVNSGFKVQGNIGAALYPTRINVGKVNSLNCYGNGLFIYAVQSVEIGSYHGYGNGQGAGATGADKNGFELNSYNATSRIMVGQIDEDTPTAVGGRVTGSGYCWIGKAYIGTPTGIGLDCSLSGETYVDDLKVNDSGSGMTYAFRATAGKGRIRQLSTNKTHSTSQSRVQIQAGLYGWDIDGIRLGSTDVLEDVIQLTNGATSTSVTCGHIWRDYVGGTSDYLSPIIAFMPLNSAARALDSMYAVMTDGTSGTGFAIKHAAAGATDYVAWKVLGWKVYSRASG